VRSLSQSHLETENHKQFHTSNPPLLTPRRVSGGFALLDSLQRHGVEYIFGYPGGAILPIYDDLYKMEATGAIKHILVRHEQVQLMPQMVMRVLLER
jgi:acetolactate synthase-1/2/3 large subunit